MGNRGCGQFITCCVCHSFLLRGRTAHTLPQLQCEVPLMGDSSPQTSPGWVLPMGSSSSWTAPVYVPSTGCSPSGIGCSSVGPPQGDKCCQQICSSVGSSLFMDPQGTHLFWCGLLHGLQVDICSTVDLHGLQGHSLPHHSLLHGLQGNLCSSAWSTSSPSFFTDLGACRALFLTYFQSSFWLLLLLYSAFFFTFLTMLSQRCYRCCWWARPWPVAGSSWSHLALALSDMGEASDTFSQKAPL